MIRSLCGQSGIGQNQPQLTSAAGQTDIEAFTARLLGHGVRLVEDVTIDTVVGAVTTLMTTLPAAVE